MQIRALVIWNGDNAPALSGMRFYFDTENDEHIAEDECVDLASVEEAKAEAVRYLAEASVDHLKSGRPLSCIVKDETRKPLMKLKLTLEVEDV